MLSGRLFRRNFEELLCTVWLRHKSATLIQHASVAQGIEHRSPKAGVDGSNPPGGTREYDGVARATPFLVCGGRRPIRAVDTRVTNFPAGGVFESVRGHQRYAEPGTATVPGSSGLECERPYRPLFRADNDDPKRWNSSDKRYFYIASDNSPS